MNVTLLVAAGGGGDALAAAIVGHALGRGGHHPVVASYSWDRYLIDPAPGPRTVADFTGLDQLTEHTWEVTRDARLIAGGTSGLSLLANYGVARFVLLDPSGGAHGLRTQLHELTKYLAADAVTLVDVGGDVFARGDEPALLSPLADALALAALAELPARTDVVVTGLGLDGELAEPYVRTALAEAGGTQHRLAPSDVRGYLTALNHHPSEATTLLAAGTLGIVGHAEIRDSAAIVPVNDAAADYFVVSHEAAMTRNAIAQRLALTRSLDEAEDAVRATCGRTELDHERAKAQALAQAGDQESTMDELRGRLDRYRIDARGRGVDLGSFRRLTEVIGRRQYDPALIRSLAGELAYDDVPLCRL